jgi:hypothetical protein
MNGNVDPDPQHAQVCEAIRELHGAPVAAIALRRPDSESKVALQGKRFRPGHPRLRARSWGYEEVGTCDWLPHTNYLSVLMRKALMPASVEPLPR